jgi:hypothetical protein
MPPTAWAAACRNRLRTSRSGCQATFAWFRQSLHPRQHAGRHLAACHPDLCAVGGKLRQAPLLAGTALAIGSEHFRQQCALLVEHDIVQGDEGDPHGADGDGDDDQCQQQQPATAFDHEDFPQNLRKPSTPVRYRPMRDSRSEQQFTLQA